MSDQLPYKDEQWNELPLPDSETSWQKMELLLDKDKKRRVPFWWWRYAALALLLAGVGTGIWLWVGRNDDKHELSKTSGEKLAKKEKVITEEETKEPIISVEKKQDKISVDKSLPEEITSIIIEPSQKQNSISSPGSKTNEQTTRVSINTESTKKVQKSKQKKTSEKKEPQTTKTSEEIFGITKSKPVTEPTGLYTTTKDSVKENSLVKKDSVKTTDSVKTVISPPVVSNDEKKEEKKKKSSFIWSAGIGLQQSIAVNGQQSSSFNYYGKKSSLSDRIPSVYLRLQKDKWFAQAEFQYAVPQPVENFYFSQKTRYDVANLSLNTERFAIQKLYYHQFPISINYHLHKNLSVGFGGMYNVLAGAVTQQEITTKNLQTGNETITRNLAPVKGFKDSFLYKTTAGILLQTDYHWKRFSLGLRYTQNFQPFIKYTKPDGSILDEKTQALQAVLRFRLWSSK